MTSEYQQELKITLATLNKFAPRKFQLLSQDIPPETMGLLEQIDSILPSITLNSKYLSSIFTVRFIYIKILVVPATTCFRI